jgi:uncharacterized membrane protein YccC
MQGSKFRYFVNQAAFFDKTKLEPVVALRNTVGTTVAFLLGFRFGSPAEGLVVGITALIVSYNDGPDPYAFRARRMLASTLLCTAASFLGSLSGYHLILSVVLSALWAFLAGYVAVLGLPAANIGLFSLVMFLIFSAHPVPLANAVHASVMTLVAGLLQTGLSLSLWPLRRLEPARRALGQFYGELEKLALSPPKTEESPPLSSQSTLIQKTLSGIGRDGDVQSERYWSLFNQAERIRLSLFSLSSLLRFKDRNVFETASRALGEIAGTIRSGKTSDFTKKHLAHLENLVNEMRDGIFKGSEFREIVYQLDGLVGQIRSADALSTNATEIGEAEFYRREVRQPWLLRLNGTLAILYSNLSLKSSSCRHAIRMAVCVIVGALLSRLMSFEHSYWMPMTIAIVLRPEFGQTVSRGVLRIAGTVAGLLLSTAIIYLFAPGNLTEIALVSVYVLLLRWLGPANYGVFAAAVSGLLVVMFSIVGVNPGDLVVARGLYTILGGAIALIAYWIWPTSEKLQTTDLMASMLDAYRDYFVSLYGGEEKKSDVGRFRTLSRIARSNFQASVQRFAYEPYSKPAEVSLLTASLASSHRFAYAVMGLDVLSREDGFSDGYRDFADTASRLLATLSESLRGGTMPRGTIPDLRDAYQKLVTLKSEKEIAITEADRITNSLNTLAEQVLSVVQMFR